MNVAFLHIEDKYNEPELQRKLAQVMVASVRNLPDVHLIQMTDFDTPILEGVDESRRLGISGYFMSYRLRHLARLKCEVLILDTDVIVLKDPSRVFQMPFDVCLTKRDKHIISSKTGYTLDDPLMPYNTGVMFSRSQSFWQDALEICEGLEERHKKWYGDQVAVASVVDSGNYNVAVLKCEKWNYTPGSETENLEGRNIVHYKGPKKQWMLNAYH